jgi:CRP/FNR family transcriptional regulator
MAEGNRPVSNAAFGHFYAEGEIIARQGEIADGLYVVQDGTVEVVAVHGAAEVVLWSAGRNEILGEMAIFGGSVRSASLRSKGRSRVLTLDKRNFMRRMSEDPSLALSMIEVMGQRVRELSREVVRLQVRSQGPETA